MPGLRRSIVVMLAVGLASGCVAVDAPEEREPVWDSEDLGDDAALTSVLAEGFATSIGGKLYTYDGDELYVLDDTKSPRSWRFEELTTGHSSHFIGDEVIVGFEFGHENEGRPFTVYEPDGEERFRYPVEDDSDVEVDVEAVTATGDVAVAAIVETEIDENGFFDTTGVLVGVSLTDGKELWREPMDLDAKDVSLAAPALVGDAGRFVPDASITSDAMRPLDNAPVVYLSAGGDDAAVAVDVQTGEERWRLTGPVEDLSAATVAMAGDFVVSIDPDVAVEDIAEVEVADIRAESTDVFTTRIEYAESSDPAVWLCDGRLLGRAIDGRPELVDLERREPVWTADEKGKPLSCMGSTVVYTTGGESHNPIGEVVTGEEETWDFGSKNVEKGFTPAYLDEKLVIGEGFENTIARDRVTGKVRWEADGSARSVCVTADHYFISDGVGLRAFKR